MIYDDNQPEVSANSKQKFCSNLQKNKKALQGEACYRRIYLIQETPVATKSISTELRIIRKREAKIMGNKLAKTVNQD